MSNYSGEERRKFPRLTAAYMIQYRLLDKTSGFDITSTRNISRGGVTITTSSKLVPGDVLNLTLKFPFTPAPIGIQAQVVSCHDTANKSVWEASVKFIDLPGDYADKIEEFIEKIARKK